MQKHTIIVTFNTNIYEKLGLQFADLCHQVAKYFIAPGNILHGALECVMFMSCSPKIKFSILDWILSYLLYTCTCI